MKNIDDFSWIILIYQCIMLVICVQSFSGRTYRTVQRDHANLDTVYDTEYFFFLDDVMVRPEVFCALRDALRGAAFGPRSLWKGWWNFYLRYALTLRWRYQKLGLLRMFAYMFRFAGYCLYPEVEVFGDLKLWMDRDLAYKKRHAEGQLCTNWT